MSDFFTHIPEREIQMLYGIWKAQKHGDLPPFKTDVVLQSLPYTLWQHLFYYDYTDDDRFFCIHNGTAVVRYFNHENTGRFLEDHLLLEFSDSLMPMYQRVVADGRAVYQCGDLPYEADRFYTYARMLLPLRAASGENRHVLGIMVVTGEERTFVRPPESDYSKIVWEDIPTSAVC